MTQYLPTILVGLAVLALVALSIGSLIKNHKRGQCACGCSACPHNCIHARPRKEQRTHQP